MLGHRVLEVHDPVEGEEPDTQGVHVVLVAHRLEEVVVRAVVHVVVDALIKFDEGAHVRGGGDRVDVGEEDVDDDQVVVGTPLRGQARGEGLHLLAHLGQRRQVARVEGGDEHASAWVDVDEALMGQGAQCLPDRCPSQAESLLQFGLAEHGARRELEGDDECPNVPVGDSPPVRSGCMSWSADTL